MACKCTAKLCPDCSKIIQGFIEKTFSKYSDAVWYLEQDKIDLYEGQKAQWLEAFPEIYQKVLDNTV